MLTDMAPTWIRSTRCESSNCVEVATLDGDVLLRDSKDVDGPVLRFSMAEWEHFRTDLIAKALPGA